MLASDRGYELYASDDGCYLRCEAGRNCTKQPGRGADALGPSRLITKLGDLGASDMRRKCTWNDVHLAGKGMMGTSALGDPRARSGGLLELHSRSALPSRFFITH